MTLKAQGTADGTRLSAPYFTPRELVHTVRSLGRSSGCGMREELDGVKNSYGWSCSITSAMCATRAVSCHQHVPFRARWEAACQLVQTRCPEADRLHCHCCSLGSAGVLQGGAHRSTQAASQQLPGHFAESKEQVHV